MDLEMITWKTMPAPTDPEIWPCMVCRDALATHRRTLRRDGATVNMIVCLACGLQAEHILWEVIQPTKTASINDICRLLAD